MPLVNRFAAGLKALVLRRRQGVDLDAELREFLRASTDAKIAAGMTPADAARAARIELGSPAAVKDWVADVGWEAWFTSVGQDVRYACRMLKRSPGFTFAAIATFALGIGANTAIFSIVDAAVLRPLPYDEPERLVTFKLHNPTTGRASTGVMPRDFLDWRERSDLFENIALHGGGVFTLAGTGEPEELRVVRVTAGFFEVYRTPPLLGRLFTRDDERPGREQVAIVSHNFWMTRLAGSPMVIGTRLHLSGKPYEIVGVLPERFSYPASAARPRPLYLPLTITDNDRLRGVIQSMPNGPTARLRDGVTTEQAEAAISQMLAAGDVHKASFNKGYLRAEAIPLLEDYVGTARSWMLMLLGAVGLVLLIACANVANLVLAHNSTRVRELTLRTAIGASRWRIARQLIAESVVLSVIGAAAGILVAWWGLGVLRGALPVSIPRASTIGLDLRVLGFTSLLALATGVVCGFLPALRGSRVDLVGGLKDGSGATAGTGRQSARHLLAWTEVALAVMLLVGAGLFISSFARLMSTEIGFNAAGITSIGYSLPEPQKGHDQDPELPRRLLDAVQALPDVEAAIVVNGGGPYEGVSTTYPLRVVGRPENADEALGFRRVSAGYLEMLGVPVLEGRGLTPTDDRHAPPVAVVNQTARRQFWGAQSPLGARFEINAITYEVVGVVRDMRYGGPASLPVPEAFLPFDQGRPTAGTLLVRSSRGAKAIPDVKAAIWSVTPGRPVTDVRTTEELFARTTAARRFNMLLMSIFASLALVIAATGIYGVIAFVVSHRTREIGVRLALGAQRSEVVGMFLRQGAVVLAAGIAAGLAGAWMLTRTIQSFLFEVGPRDPFVFTAVAVVLAAVGLLATWIPARRAARIDPLIALRSE